MENIMNKEYIAWFHLRAVNKQGKRTYDYVGQNGS